MRFIQYYLDCLSQASYLIGDETTGRAAVVDPRRAIGEYLDDDAAAGLRVEYVIETHVHADFLSGHLELAAVTGAAVVYGAGADVHFPHRTVADGERLSLGRVVLEFRATPGTTGPVHRPSIRSSISSSSGAAQCRSSTTKRTGPAAAQAVANRGQACPISSATSAGRSRPAGCRRAPSRRR